MRSCVESESVAPLLLASCALMASCMNVGTPSLLKSVDLDGAMAVVPLDCAGTAVPGGVAGAERLNWIGRCDHVSIQWTKHLPVTDPPLDLDFCQPVFPDDMSFPPSSAPEVVLQRALGPNFGAAETVERFTANAGCRPRPAWATGDVPTDYVPGQMELDTRLELQSQLHGDTFAGEPPFVFARVGAIPRVMTARIMNPAGRVGACEETDPMSGECRKQIFLFPVGMRPDGLNESFSPSLRVTEIRVFRGTIGTDAPGAEGVVLGNAEDPVFACGGTCKPLSFSYVDPGPVTCYSGTGSRDVADVRDHCFDAFGNTRPGRQLAPDRAFTSGGLVPIDGWKIGFEVSRGDELQNLGTGEVLAIQLTLVSL